MAAAIRVVDTSPATITHEVIKPALVTSTSNDFWFSIGLAAICGGVIIFVAYMYFTKKMICAKCKQEINDSDGDQPGEHRPVGRAAESRAAAERQQINNTQEALRRQMMRRSQEARNAEQHASETQVPPTKTAPQAAPQAPPTQASSTQTAPQTAPQAAPQAAPQTATTELDALLNGK